MCKTRNERSPDNEFRDGNAKPRGGYKPKHKGSVQAVDGYESGDDYAQQAQPRRAEAGFLSAWWDHIGIVLLQRARSGTM